MIYVDSCIPMYLVGAAHPLKNRVIELVPVLVRSGEELVTSAEAFQEIIHRYLAVGDRQHLHAAYEAMDELAAAVGEVRKQDTDRALALSSRYEGLSSRDCLHLAIMQRLGCRKVWTYDTRFDLVPSIHRLQ